MSQVTDRAPASPPSSRSPSAPTHKFGPLFSTPHRQRPHPRRPRRRSVDSSRHRQNKDNPSFFEHESTVFVDLDDDGDDDNNAANADDDGHNVPSTATVTMPKVAADAVRPRRNVLRIDAQDGPWTISVAENAHEPTPTPSYSLYVKTPTHNLTLTRTAREIADLHAKLREGFPHVVVPALPFDPAALPAPKRKSAFLNTLSRLASPARTTKQQQHQPPSSFHPTPPLVSPRIELDDPFAAPSPASATPADTATLDSTQELASAAENGAPPQSPLLSAYLTALANDQLLRTGRAWKRFVRVRTDDLESVRVERAIKRVRSDLAAHVAGGSSSNGGGPVSVHVLTEGSGTDKRLSRFRENIDGEVVVNGNGHVQEDTAVPREEREEDESVLEPVSEAELGGETTTQEDHTAPATPVATDAPSQQQQQQQQPRIPRSQSADPAKAARMTLGRAFAPSSASESSRADDTTGDDDDSTAPASARRSASRSARAAKRKVAVTDFEMLRVLGKGCAGKVLLVRYRKREGELYALKAITKRHVLAHQELQHTLTEQAVLRRMAGEGRDPFVVKLHWSFHDKENLFLVMDFHPGGDLATQLARWGRLGRDRARFYAAEIVEGVEGLHAAGVIYRDLKPENILIAHDGHIVLTDFGLSKEFARRPMLPTTTAPSTPSGRHASFEGPYWMAGAAGSGSPGASVENSAEWAARGVGAETTSTFCGTAEYLAPEVIQGLPYSFEVDWWSFGTMLYEMLTGITPFWADNHSDMYVRVLQDELQFPDDRAMDQDTKSLIRGLLQRNPALRIKEPRIKRHPYFSMIDWSHVYYKRYIPPYIPPIDPSNASDTQNFDDTFLDMEPVINDGADEDETDQDASGVATDTDRDSATTPSGSRASSVHAVVPEDEDVDVFDGYSYKGRHSVIIDDDVDEEDEERAEGDAEGEDEGADERSILAELNGVQAKAKAKAQEPEQTPEPKTPEARKAELPEAEAAAKPQRPAVDTAVPSAAAATAAAERPALSPTKETLAAVQAAVAASNGPDVHRKEIKKVPAKKGRREKSGVPQLDQDLSATEDEADEARTERDEDDGDWDFVEVDGEGGEDRNGARGTSLFARGVVDRYKLAVFRKGPSSQTVSQRSVSNASAATNESPKDRRGRAGLPFRRTPKQFLRPKSPRTSSQSQSQSTPSAASKSSRTASRGTPGTLSSQRSLTSTVAGAGAASPSLRSKPSETSFGSPQSSSDASVTEETTMAPHDEAEEDRDRDRDREKQNKGRKLKKYKEGAEKVLSLFASPR